MQALVERHVLPNGLTALLLVDRQAPVFSYQTWFRVGSRHERPGKTGIAHLFEHLMFKETKNMPEGEFDRTLERWGARVNAATWLDWTYYYQDVPGDRLEDIVRMEADRMENMVLNERQLEAEREVVVNERKQRVDNDPNGKLSELLWDAAFVAHPYGKPTIGWMADIEALSLEDCIAFYGTYYAPNNAVVVIVGDFDRDVALSALERHYGRLPAAEIPPPERVIEPRQTAPVRLETRLPLSGDRLMLGYKAPAMTDDDFPALEVLNEVIAEGDSARLQRALVTEGELAIGFSTMVPPFREVGLYEVAVDLREDASAEQAEETVLRVFEEVARDGITEAELSRARNKLETRFWRGLQTAQQKATSLAFWEVTGGDWRGLFAQSERYNRVTLDDVRRVAREVLRPEGRTVVVGHPDDAEDVA